MRTLLAVALASTIVLSGCTMTAPSSLPWPLTSAQTAGRERAVLSIGSQQLVVSIADTELERTRGLSGIDVLPGDGMLFVFDTADDYGIWMKDTRIPLDVVWLRDGRVAHIEASVRPEPGVADSALTIYRSPEKADAIVELAAGRASELGLATGDQLELRSLE